jgi:hypothetical protein
MSVQLSPIEARECPIGQLFSDRYAFEIPPISVLMPGRRTRYASFWTIFSMPWTPAPVALTFVAAWS